MMITTHTVKEKWREQRAREMEIEPWPASFEIRNTEDPKYTLAGVL
jgi:hypothetical protein